MSRANRMSGKYGEDDDFQPPSASGGRTRSQKNKKKEVAEEVPPTEFPSMDPGYNEEKKMQAKSSDGAIAPGAVPRRSQKKKSADSQMKKKAARSSGKKSAVELPEYAEVQAPPGRSNGASSNSIASNGSAMLPGAVAVRGTTRKASPTTDEKDLSRAASGAATTRAKASGSSEKDAAGLKVGAVAVRTSGESQHTEKDLARAPSGIAALRANAAANSTGTSDFPEQFEDDEPHSEDFSAKAKMKISVGSKGIQLDSSLVPPPEATTETAVEATLPTGVDDPLEADSGTMPGALRISGQHSGIEEDDFEDGTDASAYEPQTISLPAAMPVLDEEQPSPVLLGSIQEALPDTEEEPVVRKGVVGWIETHRVRSLIIVLLLVGAIIGGLVGGLAGGGSSSNPSAAAPSAAPTTQEYGAIFSVVSQLTLPDVLQDPSTPQNAALMWMVENDSFNTTDEGKILQRYVLATLYYSTQGDSWVDQVNFLSAFDECDWNDGSDDFVGASCDEEGNVFNIWLSSHNLEGFIPAELSALSSLTFFSMANNNKLAGTIPPGLFSLQNIRDIRLFANDLSGSLPSNIGDMTQLTLLRVQFNRLTGRLPDSLGNLELLTQLSTHDNQFTGPIPGSMGQLSNLVTWFNDDNQMTGQVPPEAKGMISLTNLYLDGNEFTGTMEPFCVNTTVLSIFRADCYKSDIFQITPEVVCPCCSTCCDARQGCVQANTLGS